MLSRLDTRRGRGDPARDPQRIVRALEVLDSTGVPLTNGRSHPPRPFSPPRNRAHDPLSRRGRCCTGASGAALTAWWRRCTRRGGGAVARAARPEPAGNEAIGVEEFAAVLAGSMPLAQAVAKAKTETRATPSVRRLGSATRWAIAARRRVKPAR